MKVAAGSLAAALASASPDSSGTSEPPRPSSYQLEWTAPAACPDQEAVRREIEELLDNVSGKGGSMQVRATVTQVGPQYRLSLSTEFLGQVDERPPVVSSDCREISRTLALTVAIALDPGEQESTSPSPSILDQPSIPDPPPPRQDAGVSKPTPMSVTEGRARQSPPVVTTSDRHTPKRHALGIGMHLAPVMSVGALPRVGAGTELAFELLWPRVRLELLGVYLWPQRNRSNSGLFQLGTAGARGCGRLFVGRIEFPVCAGAEAGLVRAASRGLPASTTIHAGWVAGLAGAGVAVQVGRVGFWSLAETSVPLLRPQFFVGDAIVLRSAPVTLRIAAGLEVFFR